MPGTSPIAAHDPEAYPSSGRIESLGAEDPGR
jgi:hypothetical protein